MVTRLPQDFKDFLRLLGEHHVEYLLIGGYAVAHYGYPRPTYDFDIWIAMSPKNAHVAKNALATSGFSEPALTEAAFLQPERILRMGYPPMRRAIMTTIEGVAFDDCYVRRNTVEIDGQQADLISLNDLRINKAASGQAKDLNDLQQLPQA